MRLHYQRSDSHVENSVSVAWPEEHATTKFMIDTSNALQREHQATLKYVPRIS